MSKRLPSNRAWSAAGVLRMLIICALRNHRHSAARSVMSSRFRFAEDITAKFTIAVMKPPGGIRPVSTRPSLLDHCGYRRIHLPELELQGLRHWFPRMDQPSKWSWIPSLDQRDKCSQHAIGVSAWRVRYSAAWSTVRTDGQERIAHAKPVAGIMPEQNPVWCVLCIRKVSVV